MALTLNNNLNSLKVGNYFWCKYTVTTAGTVGVFSDIAIKTDAEATPVIPIASTNLPNGYFKFIMVEDTSGKKKLIADRNIQHSISWDVLNTSGIASGSGLPTLFAGINKNNYNLSMRLLTGGITSTDLDNEWNKYIVNSTLDGNVAVGDNNIWNWSGIYTWTSTTTTPNSYRAIRGSTVNGWNAGGPGSQYVGTNVSFRPVLEIESLMVNKSFILLSDGYKKFIKGNPKINIPSVDLTSGKTYASSSNYDTTNTPDKVFDDNSATRWLAASVGGNHWVSVDLGTIKNIKKVTLVQDTGFRCDDFRIEYSDDNLTWNVAFTGLLLKNTNKQEFTFNSGSHRYWRLYIVTNTSSGSGGIAEMELMEEELIIPAIPSSWATVSTILPSLTQFQTEGIDDLSIFDRKIQEVLGNPKVMGSEVLGVGTVYKTSINLKKIFDLRKIEVK